METLMNRAAGSWWCFALTLVCQQIFGGMATAQTNPWKIGAVLCLTGGCANLGTDSVKGAQMALDEINSRGGVLGRTLKLVVQDTSEAVSGAQAVSAYKQLRTDKDIHYFIGPTWAPAGLALAPIVAQEKDIVMMSPSLGAPEFHKAGENIFNSRGTDEVASRMAARYAFKKGFKRAAIFSSQQPWETAQADFFEDEFTKLGGSLVMRVEPLPTVSDVGTEALRIVSKKPDVVFISTMVLMPRAARKLRELKYAGFLMGSYIDET